MHVKKQDGKYIITDFDEAEAYQLASKVENDGILFYTFLSLHAPNVKIKDIMEFLIEKEKEHLRFFQECLNRLPKEKLRALEKTNILTIMDTGIFKPFHSIKEEIKNMTAAQVLQWAVDVENESINFYLACLDYVPEDTKKQLSEVLAEEGRHKSLLTDLLAKES